MWALKLRDSRDFETKLVLSLLSLRQDFSARHLPVQQYQ